MAAFSFFTGNNQTFKSHGFHFQEVANMSVPKAKPKQNQRNTGQSSWNRVEAMIANLRRTMAKNVLELEDPVLEKIASFCHSNMDGEDGLKHPDLLSCGSVVFGHSSSDQDRLLHRLESRVEKGFCTIRLHSSAFSNLSRAVQHFVKRTLSKLEDGSETEMIWEDEESEATSKGTATITMRDLEDFYSQGRKKTKTLLLIFEDVESFPFSVLNSFLQICASFQQEIPMVCILGLKSSEEVLQSLLCSETTAKLVFSTFRFPGPESLLSRVFHNCVNSFPWKPEAKLVDYLLSTAKEDNASPQRLQMLLEFAILHRALTFQPFSLCLEAEEVETGLASAPEPLLDSIFALPSMKGTKAEKKRKEQLSGIIQDLGVHWSEFGLSLALLHCFLKGTEQAAPLPQLYSALLSEAVALEDLVGGFQYWSSEEAEKKILEGVQVLRQISAPGAEHFRVELISKLEEFGTRYSTVETEQAEHDKTSQENVEKEVETTFSKNKARPTRAQVQEAMKKRIQLLKEGPRHELKSKFLTYIKRTFKESLSETNLPGAEIVLLPWTEALARKVSANLWGSAHRFLTLPYNSEAKEPDVCILFRLYRVARLKSLDVSDWLNGFREEVGKVRKKQDKAKLTAAFFLAVAELELNGIVRGSEKRSRTVQRIYKTAAANLEMLDLIENDNSGTE